MGSKTVPDHGAALPQDNVSGKNVRVQGQGLSWVEESLLLFMGLSRAECKAGRQIVHVVLPLSSSGPHSLWLSEICWG